MTALHPRLLLLLMASLAVIGVILLAGCGERPITAGEETTAELANDFPIDFYQGAELLGGSTTSFKTRKA